VRRINHTGWLCCADCGITIRGLVLRLPHGRYLVGWSMGIGWASAVETDCIYDDMTEAAYAADESARIAAEKERAYQEQLETIQAQQEVEAASDVATY
jgi:hypothetical protein